MGSDAGLNAQCHSCKGPVHFCHSAERQRSQGHENDVDSDVRLVIDAFDVLYSVLNRKQTELTGNVPKGTEDTTSTSSDKEGTCCVS